MREQKKSTGQQIILSGFLFTTSVRPVNPDPVGFPLIAHSALPFSELEKQIGSNVLMSDVIGLIAGVTDLLPPTGNA